MVRRTPPGADGLTPPADVRVTQCHPADWPKSDAEPGGPALTGCPSHPEHEQAQSMPLGRSEVKDCERSRHSHPGAVVPRGWHERPGRRSRGQTQLSGPLTPRVGGLGSAAIQTG